MNYNDLSIELSKLEDIKSDYFCGSASFLSLLLIIDSFEKEFCLNSKMIRKVKEEIYQLIDLDGKLFFLSKKQEITTEDWILIVDILNRYVAVINILSVIYSLCDDSLKKYQGFLSINISFLKDLFEFSLQAFYLEKITLSREKSLDKIKEKLNNKDIIDSYYKSLIDEKDERVDGRYFLNSSLFSLLPLLSIFKKLMIIKSKGKKPFSFPIDDKLKTIEDTKEEIANCIFEHSMFKTLKKNLLSIKKIIDDVCLEINMVSLKNDFLYIQNIIKCTLKYI